MVTYDYIVYKIPEADSVEVNVQPLDLTTFTETSITDRAIRLLVQESTRYAHNAATPPASPVLQMCSRIVELNGTSNRLYLFRH